MIRYIFATTAAAVIIGLALLVVMLPTQAPSTGKLESSNSSEANLAPTTNSFLITDVKLFDGNQFLDTHSIRVEDGLITRIELNIAPKPNEHVIDGKGLTAFPGLIDAHTHSYGNGLADALRFGVTTHLDMFTSENTLKATRAAREQLSRTDEADLFSSGTLATVKGGHGTQYGFAIDTIDSITEIESWVSSRKQAGVDYIKLVYMPHQQRIPSLDKATASEVIKVAQSQGLRVYAHISTHDAAKDMIEQGIDGLVHIFADAQVSDELLELAKQRQVIIIPTLAVIASVDGSQQAAQLAIDPQVESYLSAQQISTLKASFGYNIPGFDLAIAKSNVKRFFDAGVPILAGSDAPNSGTAYGISAYHEMFLLVESGLTPAQAMAAATSMPAKYFNLPERGQLRVGNRADLVLVSGDPSQDLRDLLAIQMVFKNGFSIERRLASSSKVGPSIPTPILGDFEDPNRLTEIDDFKWSLSDDTVANGKSSATITFIRGGANDSKGALGVNAKVNPGFPFPWAGAALGDFVAPINGLDISKYSKLMFDIKGTSGTYRVLSFSADASGVPPSQYFKVSEQWQRITISLSDFRGFNTKLFSGFAFIAGPEHGEFEFILDNVQLVEN